MHHLTALGQGRKKYESREVPSEIRELMQRGPFSRRRCLEYYSLPATIKVAHFTLQDAHLHTFPTQAPACAAHDQTAIKGNLPVYCICCEGSNEEYLHTLILKHDCSAAGADLVGADWIPAGRAERAA